MGPCPPVRHVAAACLVTAVTIGASAGCTPGGASTSSTPASGAAPTARPAALAPELPGRALASPGCSSATAAGTLLGPAGTTSVATGGGPFGVAATPDGRWAFAATSGGPGLAGAPSVEVLRLTAGRGAGAAPVLTKVRSIRLPAPPGTAGLPAGAVQPAGTVITSNGKYLLVAEGSGAVVISVVRAESGTAGAVLGSLAAPASTGAGAPLGGAIEAAVSPDGRFAFVTLEDEGEAAVFNLSSAVAHGFGAADYVGAIPLGGHPWAWPCHPTAAGCTRQARGRRGRSIRLDSEPLAGAPAAYPAPRQASRRGR
jgi:DNA-binding beta-propeller fold protein YncE